MDRITYYIITALRFTKCRRLNVLDGAAVNDLFYSHRTYSCGKLKASTKIIQYKKIFITLYMYIYIKFLVRDLSR